MSAWPFSAAKCAGVRPNYKRKRRSYLITKEHKLLDSKLYSQCNQSSVHTIITVVLHSIIWEVTAQHIHIQYKLLIAANICDKQTVVVTYSFY